MASSVVFDVACPICGPARHSPLNQRRPVLRVWRPEPGFASFYCARCDEQGYVHDGSTARPRPNRRVIEQIKIETAERECITAAERMAKARWLWARGRPIAGTVAETYLRTARAYGGPLPATARLFAAARRAWAGHDRRVRASGGA